MNLSIFGSINKFSLLILLLSTVLTACGGGSSNPDNGAPSIMTGQFIDSAVAGLRYQTATQSGYTNAAGTFNFIAGETVSFFIGDILLGSVIADTQITPIDLVSGASDGNNPQVQNLIRFIQSLDEDANPDNGITISNTITTFAAGQTLDFTLDGAAFETTANALLDYLTAGSVTQLISAGDALDHLNLSLGGTTGSGSLTLSGNDTAIISDSFMPVIAVSNLSSSGHGIIDFQQGTHTLQIQFYDSGMGISAAVVGLVVPVVVSNNSQIDLYSYITETCMLPCSGMTLDLDARSVSFDNLTLPLSDLETNAATAEITLNGTLSWQ